MKHINLHKLSPEFISDAGNNPAFEIWFREVGFVKGQNYLISASSGQGKSSLLSFIFGERSDYAGEIFFDDREIKSLKNAEWQNIRKNNLSFVFQGLRLFSDLTVLENIKLKNNLSKHKTVDEIKYMIERTGLADKMNEKAGRLSFGQQQRIATLRALCQPFDFILLDEPFSHLDEKNIEIMSEIIVGEIAQKNAGLILCSLGYEYPFKYNKKYRI